MYDRLHSLCPIQHSTQHESMHLQVGCIDQHALNCSKLRSIALGCSETLIQVVRASLVCYNLRTLLTPQNLMPHDANTTENHLACNLAYTSLAVAVFWHVVRLPARSLSSKMKTKISCPPKDRYEDKCFCRGRVAATLLRCLFKIRNSPECVRGRFCSSEDILMSHWLSVTLFKYSTLLPLQCLSRLGQEALSQSCYRHSERAVMMSNDKREATYIHGRPPYILPSILLQRELFCCALPNQQESYLECDQEMTAFGERGGIPLTVSCLTQICPTKIRILYFDS